MNIDQIIVEKGLSHLAIEKALLNIGERALKQVGNQLYAKHRCYFSDCLEHPEYLKDVLDEIFGKASIAIIDSIQIDLKEFTEKKTISKFLVQLSR